jgi:hypothetical protein
MELPRLVVFLSPRGERRLSTMSQPTPTPVSTGPSSPDLTVRNYRVFISYSHADTRWANWLLRRLEGYRVSARFHGRLAPIGVVARRIAPVFRDRDELPTTSDLGETIRTALRQSATLVVICSPHSAKSRWVQEEIVTFKRLHGERRVFAFIVGGEPKAAGTEEDCFSPALRTEVGADGALSGVPAEVVAADARPHGDGPRVAFMRLTAGLLGVGFDDLRQRELQRRNRRLTLIAAAAVAGMALTLALAAAAWRARGEAVLARNDAQRRQDQAEDVLAFMLGDFRDDLKKVGQLSLLQKVGTKAMAYFDAANPRDLTDTALARQARALTQIGEIRLDQKGVRYAEAVQAFVTAHERASALVNRHPRDGDMLFERAQAEFWIGNVHWKAGYLTAAAEWMGRYRDTGAALVRLDPSSVRAQGELAHGHHNLAVLEISRGGPESARAGFLAELTLLERLLALGPETVDLQHRVSDAHSWLGSLAELTGDFAEASARFAEQIRQLEALVQREPRTARWKIRLADALAIESSLLAITGRRIESLARRQRARTLVEPLVAQDPANRTWLSAALNLKLKEAMVLQAEGDEAGAARLAAEARAGYEKLHEAEPSARIPAGQLAMALRLEAELGHRAGSPVAATAAARAITIGQNLVSEIGGKESYLGDYVLAYVIAGSIARRNGDEAGALRHWQTGWEVVQPRLAGSRNWRLLDPGARVLAALGRWQESRALSEQLTRLRYEPLTPWP